MHIPKPGLLHFLALSVSLNVVLIGLVAHFLTEEKPSAVAVAETPRHSETAGLPASRVPSTPTAPAPVSTLSTSTPSQVAPTTASYQAAPVQEFAPPVAQQSWTPSSSTPVASAGTNGSAKPTNSAIYNPATPGNSFEFNGTRVAIEGESLADDGSSAGVLISLSGGSSNKPNAMGAPVGNSASTVVTSGTSATGNGATPYNQNTSNQTTPTANQSANSSIGRTARRGVFTYEQELFRAKWGWQAFNAAQTAAATSAPQ